MTLERINSILANVRNDFQQGLFPSIELQVITNKRKLLLTENGKDIDRQYTRRVVSFKTAPKQFTILIKLLIIIKVSLENEKLINKRDVYYQDAELFQTQDTVDRALNNICTTLQVISRFDLNIITSSKGLVYGKITIFGANGVITEGHGGDDNSMQIPTNEDIVSVRLNEPINYILVVEKDAVFKHLFQHNTICITGKGFPDFATRRLLHVLNYAYIDIPIYALVDSDPHGIQIFSTFKYGSAKATFDNQRLISHRIEYLGVKITEFEQGWLDMTSRDIQLARSILKTNTWLDDECKRQLQMNLFLQKKAELNVVMKNQIKQYLDSKIKSYK